MRYLFIIFSGLLCLSFISNVSAQSNPSQEHAPIGVMGDHVHKKGEWMTSYSYKNTQMSGLSNKTRLVESAGVIARGFSVTPLSMNTDMHMFGAMYGYSERLTFMAMVPFMKMTMYQKALNGSVFSRQSEGIGDMEAAIIYNSHHDEDLDVFLNIGTSLPLGSVLMEDVTHLPYPMQLGSGTLDFMPGITVTGRYNERITWGTQAKITFRNGGNVQKYRLGNQYDFTTWASHDLSKYMNGRALSGSFRLHYLSKDHVVGADKDIPVLLSPAMSALLQSGQKLDASVGINYEFTDGRLKGHRLAFEYGVPVSQYLDGPQLNTQSWVMAGWQYSF